MSSPELGVTWQKRIVRVQEEVIWIGNGNGHSHTCSECCCFILTGVLTLIFTASTQQVLDKIPLKEVIHILQKGRSDVKVLLFLSAMTMLKILLDMS